MPFLPNLLRLGASTAASALEATAGVLRSLAGDAQRPAPRGGAVPVAVPPIRSVRRGVSPASGTRARIADPKAARKVRAREG